MTHNHALDRTPEIGQRFAVVSVAGAGHGGRWADEQWSVS
jgi:hypothetical protein